MEELRQFCDLSAASDRLSNKSTRLLAFASLIVISSIQTVFACDCDAGTRKSQLSSSQSVFIGKVIQVIEYGDQHEKRARIKVLKAWKGAAVGRILVVEAGISGGLCGVDFEKGHQYMVFANWSKEKHLVTSICKGTGPFEDSKGTPFEVEKADPF